MYAAMMNVPLFPAWAAPVMTMDPPTRLALMLERPVNVTRLVPSKAEIVAAVPEIPVTPAVVPD